MAVLNLLSAENLDIHLYQGDTAAATLEFFDAEDQPLSLSATSVTMEVKKNAYDPNVLFTFTNSSGLSLQGNRVVIQSLAQLPRGNYYYDLSFTFSGNQVVTYLMGQIQVI